MVAEILREYLEEALDVASLESRLLRRSEASQARSVDELAQIIRDLGDHPATLDAVNTLVEGDGAAMMMALVREKRLVPPRKRPSEASVVRWWASQLLRS